MKQGPLIRSAVLILGILGLAWLTQRMLLEPWKRALERELKQNQKQGRTPMFTLDREHDLAMAVSTPRRFTDEELREHGFVIWIRKDGQPPTWTRRGKRFSQADAENVAALENEIRLRGRKNEGKVPDV